MFYSLVRVGLSRGQDCIFRPCLHNAFPSPLSNEARQLLHSINSHASHCCKSLVSPCLKVAGKNPGGEEEGWKQRSQRCAGLDSFPHTSFCVFARWYHPSLAHLCGKSRSSRFALDLSLPQASLPHSLTGQSLSMKRQNENKSSRLFSPYTLRTMQDLLVSQ